MKKLIMMLAAAVTAAFAQAGAVVDTDFTTYTGNTLPDGWTEYQYNGSNTPRFVLNENGALVNQPWKQNALDTDVSLDSGDKTVIDVVTFSNTKDCNAIIYLSSASYSICIGNSYNSNNNVYVGTLDSAASGNNVSFQSGTGKNPTVKATYTTVDVGKPLTYHLVLEGASLTGTVTDGTNTDTIDVTLDTATYAFTKAGLQLDGSPSTVGVKSVKVSKPLTLYRGSDVAWSASSKFSLDPDYPNEETTVPDSLDVIDFTADATVYVSKDYKDALNIKINSDKTVTFGHDEVVYTYNNKNLNDGSVITMEDGAVALFGYWGNGHNKGYALVGDITVNGGTIKQDVANSLYLQMGTISGSTTIDTTSNSDSYTADIRATAVNGTVTGTGTLTLSGGASSITGCTATPITLGEDTSVAFSFKNPSSGNNAYFNVTGAGSTSVVTLKPTEGAGLTDATVFKNVKLVIDGDAGQWIGCGITAENVDLVVNSVVYIENNGPITFNTISGSALLDCDTWGGHTPSIKLTGISTYEGKITVPVVLAEGASLTCADVTGGVTAEDGSKLVQNGNTYTAVAKTATELFLEAVAAANEGDTVTATGDLEITSTVSLAKGITIDLGGFTLTGVDVRPLWITEGTTTVQNGTVTTAPAEGGYSKLGDSSSVIRVGDNSGTAAGLVLAETAKVTTDRCYGITYFGKETNGQTVVIDGTVETTGVPALSGNGSKSYKTANVTVNGTVTTTDENAIYKPEAGTLTVNGTVTGKGGIEAKAGTVEITADAKVTATAEATTHNPYSNGCSSSGYAVAAVQNSAYKGNVAITIDEGAAVAGPISYLADTTTTKEGTTAPVIDCQDNAITVAQLEKDLAAGSSVKLIGDASIDATIALEKDTTLDLGGYTLTGVDCRPLWIKEGTTTVTNGTVTTAPAGDAYATSFSASSSVIRVGDGSKTVVSGTSAGLVLAADAKVTTDHCYGITYFGTETKGQTIVIDGTVETTTVPALSGNGSSWWSEATVTVNGTVKTTAENAIYKPEAGTLTVNGTVEGQGGIEAKAGTVIVTGTVSASGTLNHEKNGNGCSTSGYAIAAVQNKSYKGNVSFAIKTGATITGEVAYIEDTVLKTGTEAPVITKAASVKIAAPEGYMWAAGTKLVKSSAEGISVSTETDAIKATITDGTTCAITGTGVINDTTGIADYKNTIQTVTIDDYATEIAANAFNKFYGLNTVTVGKGVTKVGANAFGSCNSLVSIDFANSATKLEEGSIKMHLAIVINDEGQPETKMIPEINGLTKTIWGSNDLVNWTEVGDGEEGNYHFFKATVGE